MREKYPHSTCLTYCGIGLLLTVSVASATPNLELTPGSGVNGAEVRLDLETIPGIRYGLYHSEDLRNWSFLPGFPRLAGEASENHIFMPESDRGFFRAAKLGPPPEGLSLIPGGTFVRGDNRDEYETRMQESRPAGEIYVSPFYIGRTPVTYTEWIAVYQWAIENGYTFNGVHSRGWLAGAGELPDDADNNRHPVVNVSWHDAIKWCNARSEMEGLTPVYYVPESGRIDVFRTSSETGDVDPDWTANGYRLPTEVEWEKAARGGIGGALWPWGRTDPEGILGNFAGSRSEYGTTPVGYHPANAFGLYDMLGNVWEWCWDKFQRDWYQEEQSTHPDTRGPATIEENQFGAISPRVVRGGSWTNIPDFSYLSFRNAWSTTSSSSGFTRWFQSLGFRVARNADPEN